MTAMRTLLILWALFLVHMAVQAVYPETRDDSWVNRSASHAGLPGFDPGPR